MSVCSRLSFYVAAYRKDEILDMKELIQKCFGRCSLLIRWVLVAGPTGVILGIFGGLFGKSITEVTAFRNGHPWMLYLLPAAGLLIVAIYKLDPYKTGTNKVLEGVQSDTYVPLRMAPLIVIATVLTHACGGSAGREGAALQLGGSIGGTLGKWMKFDEYDHKLMIMCGMSAGFSALFGTPLAAAIFSMEVVSVGIMHYSALLPCVIASLTAHGVAAVCGITPEIFPISSIPAFAPKTALIIGVFAVLCAVVSILFCTILHNAERLYKRFFKNPYLRVIIGGCIVIALTLLVGDQTYNGTGMSTIASCMEGKPVFPLAFLLKMLFTGATLGAGYKGGEIVPTLFIGATFGTFFATVTGCSIPLCAAVGMGAVFCGVTNSPITSLLICFELFGFEGMPYFLIAIALSYMLSGYYGLYKSQKFIYSKIRTEFINRKAN